MPLLLLVIDLCASVLKMVEFDIYSAFIPLLIFVFVYLFSYFLEVFSNRKKLIISFFVIILLSLIPVFSNCIKDLRNSINTIAQYSYIRDKIRLFYSYKEAQPYSSLYLFSRPAWILTKYFPFVESDDVIYFAKNTFDNSYYPICYRRYILDYPADYIFLEFDELKKQFENDGGTLHEVYSNNFDFDKLSDRNFVLNNPKNQICLKILGGFFKIL